MPKMYDKNDIVDVKNRKLRQKRRKKLLIILIAAVILITLFAARGLWIPMIKGWGNRYKTIVNSGKLADGKFPIEVSGGEDYQLRYTVKKIMVQNDTTLYIYDIDGSLLKKRQHAYSNPNLCVANGKALLYESGGNEFSVEDEDEVYYSRSFDNNIYFARLSSDGVTAVVTESDDYSCELKVYDKKGTLIYERKCTDMLVDLSFINESKGCVLGFLSAENGQLTTKIREISFSSKGEKWTSPGFSTCAYEIFGSSEGTFIYGDTACGYIDPDGQISSYYEYDGTCVSGASMSGKSAVVVNNDDSRTYTAALFSGNGKKPLIIELNSPAVAVSVFRGLAYVLTQEEVQAYDFSGHLRSTASVNDSYSGFVRSDDHIFLKGFDKIDRIDYDTGT